MYATSPLLKEIYNEKTGLNMKLFHLEDATALIIPPVGEPEKIL